jgi:hypothetical protein
MLFLLYLSIPIGIDPVETNEALSFWGELVGACNSIPGTASSAAAPVLHLAETPGSPLDISLGFPSPHYDCGFGLVVAPINIIEITHIARIFLLHLV